VASPPPAVGIAQRVAVTKPKAVSPSPQPSPAVIDPGAPGTPPAPPPVDTTPPETSIQSGPSGTTTATNGEFTFAATEADSTFSCQLDEGGWSSCSSPESFSGLAIGPHVFSVRAADTAGNLDLTPANRNWTIEEEEPPIDTTPPNTSIRGGPVGTTTATTATFELASSEEGSTFECKLDADEWSVCSSPKSLSGLAEGSHVFSVRATDAAENVDPTPASRSWTVVPSSEPPPPACTATVSTLTAAESAISNAEGGEVICLADGSYGEADLSASPPGRVILRAEHPGLATIDGASMAGANLTLERFTVSGEVQVQPSSSGMTVAHNQISGGYFGVEAAPTSTVSVDDVAIVGNQLIGPFGEDAIHLNRYHDGDGDGVGVLVEGNEITNVRENGNHSDCLQTVWVGDHIVFRRNYLHDNRCQGFFVKDQASPVIGITVEDNLFVRNNEPCDPSAPDCGQPAYFQIFGPYEGLTMRRNTIWQGDVTTAFQEGTGPDTLIEANVVNRFWTSTDLSGITYQDNTRCSREASGGAWPSSVPGETVDCSPPFNDPESDDFRLIGSARGVDWAPAEMHFGP
jgi:hypothetical protein